MRILPRYKIFIFVLLFIANNGYSAMTVGTFCHTLLENIVSLHTVPSIISEHSSYKSMLRNLKKEGKLDDYFSNSENGYDFSRRARLGLLVGLDYDIVLEYFKKIKNSFVVDTLVYEDLFLFNFNKKDRIAFFKSYLEYLRERKFNKHSIFKKSLKTKTKKSSYFDYKKIIKHNNEVLKWIKSSEDDSKNDLIKYMLLVNSELYEAINLSDKSANKNIVIPLLIKQQFIKLDRYIYKQNGLNLFDYMIKKNFDDLRMYDIDTLIAIFDIKELNREYLKQYVVKYLDIIFGKGGRPKTIDLFPKHKGSDPINLILHDVLHSYRSNGRKISINNIEMFNAAFGTISDSIKVLMANISYSNKLYDHNAEVSFKATDEAIIEVMSDLFVKINSSDFLHMYKYFIDKGYFEKKENLSLLLEGIEDKISISDTEKVLELFIYTTNNLNEISERYTIKSISQLFRKYLTSHYEDFKLNKITFAESFYEYVEKYYPDYTFNDLEELLSKYVDLDLLDTGLKIKILLAELQRSSRILNPKDYENIDISYKELHDEIKGLSRKYPELINNKELSKFLIITNSNTLYYVLSNFFRNNIEFQDNNLKYFLSYFGLKYAGKDFKDIDKFVNKAMSLLVDISSKHKITTIIREIDQDLLATSKGRRKVLTFLERYRNIVMLIDSEHKVPPIFSNKLELKNIDEHIETATEVLYTKINVLFSNDLDLSIEKLEALSLRWGDLNSIFTLLGRYSSKVHWKDELIVMKEIFTQVLNNNFKNYKYFGSQDISDIEKTKKQLSSLNDKSIKNWVKNYNKLMVTTSNNSDSSDRIGIINDTINANLIPHINDLIGETGHSKHLNKVQERIQRYKGNPTLLPGLLANEFSYNDNKILRNDILRAFTFLFKNIDSNTKRYLSHFKILSKNKELEVSNEVQNDISYLLKIMNEKNEKQSDAIIFGTTVDHPKLLLETGCLVSAASCQDYRLGGHIQTLPGYVIDANTKILLSFALKSKYFRTISDYELVRKAIVNSEDIKTEFIANEYIIKFTINNKEIIAENLRAVSRNVLRLGSSENKPVVFAERDYRESLAYSNELSYIKKSILDTITNKIDGIEITPGMSINIEASRNILGTYSDAGNGVKTSSFKIEVRN